MTELKKNVVDATVTLSITRSNCFAPKLEGTYAEKLRLNINVLPATDVYEVVHSVTIVEPDLVVAGILSNS